MTQLQATKIEELKNSFKGEILLPGSDAYESARKIWNAMIDRHPALIARCATTSDVRPRGELRERQWACTRRTRRRAITSPAMPCATMVS